jgi:dihydropyrimidinase
MVPVLDLAIRHGTVVTADQARRADVGIQDGTIVELGSVGSATQEIDGSGLLVLPGGVDEHTHFEYQPRPDGPWSADDWLSGTIAAACGGVTTVVDYARQSPGQTVAQTLQTWDARARPKAVIDYAFHIVPADTEQATLDQLAQALDQGLTATVKIFMNRVTDAGMLKLLEMARAHGALAMVHAESTPLDEAAYRRLVSQQRATPEAWSEARPQASEAEATSRAIDYAEYTGANICMVHVSCARALERVRAGKARRAPVWAETRPCYLLLTSEHYAEPPPRHLMYTGYPPLREPEDLEALWAGVRDGAIDSVGSDHAPWSLEAKAEGNDDLTRMPVGIPGIETQTRLLFSEGVNKNRISAERFVEVMSTNPARLQGLYPRKGTIAEGSDADLVLIDPARGGTIRYTDLHHRCGYEPTEGMSYIGWPVMTIARGEVVARDGQPVAQPGRGHLLQRARFDPASAPRAALLTV